MIFFFHLGILFSYVAAIHSAHVPYMRIYLLFFFFFKYFYDICNVYISIQNLLLRYQKKCYLLLKTTRGRIS